jgi:hypothetical protein
MRNREESRVRIAPGEKVGLDLNFAEREIVLNKLLCLDAELEQAVRATADDDPVMLSLDDLEDLHGHCAAEANHTSNKKLKKALGGALRKIELLMLWPQFESPFVKGPPGSTSYELSAPYWLLVLASAALGASPWLRWQFSLRTLFIAMMLVALVMGAIVYAIR